jgi:hypothetical protein
MTTSSDFAGARWRKSSRSTDTGDCIELAWRKSSRSASSGQCIELAWRKSSRSASTGECVELAHTEAVFGIRDSKNADGPVLALGTAHGLAFLGAVRSDRLTRS